MRLTTECFFSENRIHHRGLSSMASNIPAEHTEKMLCDYVENAHLRIPDLKSHYILLNQMNTLLHKLLKNMNNNDAFQDVQDVQLHADMDPGLVDTLSSIKLLLSSIQKHIDLLYNIGIHVKSIDKGIFGIALPHSERKIQLLWHVGDEEIYYWEEADSIGNMLKRPIHELTTTLELVSP